MLMAEITQDSECLYRDIFKYFLSKIEEEKPDF